jgi:hypothetical protein
MLAMKIVVCAILGSEGRKCGHCKVVLGSEGHACVGKQSVKKLFVKNIVRKKIMNTLRLL